MNLYAWTELVLNQSLFSALLIVFCAAALLRPDVKTLAILFWTAGYFSTQIPLVLGYEIGYSSRLVMQGLVSFCLIVFVLTLPPSKFLIMTACAELAMILINAMWVGTVEYLQIINLTSWHHWALFGILNYISFTGVCLNKWGDKERESRPITSALRSGISLGHVYDCGSIMGKSPTEMAQWKD